jgi:hypothetical protein
MGDLRAIDILLIGHCRRRHLEAESVLRARERVAGKSDYCLPEVSLATEAFDEGRGEVLSG